MANSLRKKTPPPPPVPSADELAPDKEVEVTVQEVVKDERTRRIAGSASLLFTFFIFFALTSYIFSWQEDFDKVQQFGLAIFDNADIRVNNLLGAIGAYVAHNLIFNGFGLASYTICAFFFALSINLLFGKRIFNLLRNIKYVIACLLVISTTLSFFTVNEAFSWGGATGEMLQGWLSKWIGRVGTGALLFTVYFAYYIWLFNPSFQWLDVSKWLSPKKEPATAEEPIVNSWLAEDDSLLIKEQTQEEEKVVAIKPVTTLSGNKLKDGAAPVNLQLPTEEEQPENPLNQFDLVEKAIEQQPEPEINWEEEKTLMQDLPVAITPPIEAVTTKVVGSPIFEVNSPITENTDNPIFSLHQQSPSGKLYIDEKVVPTPKPSSSPEKVPAFEVTVPIAENEHQAETVSNLQAEKHLGLYEPTMDLRDYRYPKLDLLDQHGSDKIIQDTQELEANKNQIIETLKNYDIDITRIAATVGPTVTLYEIVPAPGVRISKIKNLEDDIALSLSALGIRIIAPIPGRGTIGIEVPNVNKTMVSMRTLLSSDKFQNTNFSLPIAIGKKIDNENFIVDLAAMPHLLMAGATGQGKSVGINALLISLLYKKHPSQLKFVLVDPKKVELSIYRCIEKHFLAKLPGEEESIITDTKKVVNTLNALCIEMDNRYDLLKEAGCRNIKEYNDKFINRKLNPQKGHQYLPFIVLVVDEFADLIMTAGKEVEMPIARLAQLARAIGIHLIIATQRPSVNIITGTIKANFPARIAFKVSSKIDSRTILDAGGAEQLIGKGDMLISYNGNIVRLQCAFVDTPEVDKVCSFIGDQRGYPEAFLLPEYIDEKDAEGKGDFDADDRDPLFEDAARLIVQNQVGSTSLIQRRMKLGYNRAGRLMDQLERAGIVGPNLGSKAREVKFTSEMELEDFLANL